MNDHDDDTTVPAIGPLQLRVMHALWRQQATTVCDVATALNAEPGAKRLAYTTFLTVMRNLVRHGLLHQEKAGVGKAHRFTARIGETAYKRAYLRQVTEDYCGGDPAVLMQYLEAPAKA